MIKIIDEHWPLVVAVVNGQITEADIEEMFRVYEVIHARGERFFLVQEARAATMPDAMTRRRLADLNTHFAEQIESHVVAVGVVVAGRVASGVLSAIFWLTRAATVMFTATSGAEIFDKGATLCEREGVPLPESARQFLEQLDAAYGSEEGLGSLFPPSSP